MRRGWKVLIGLLAVVVVVVAAGLWYARPLLLTGTGYAAHNACAVQLVAGRDADAPARDLPPNPLVPYLRTTVDASEGTARSSVLGALFGQTAFHTEVLGCTLSEDRPALDPPSHVALPEPGANWPAGDAVGDPPADVDVEALEAAVEAAFAEPPAEVGGVARGTRAVVVVHDGQIVAERYAEGFDADTPQLGWSMAKSVTNAMVGRLVTDGSMAVAESGLLSAWQDERADITVEDLLHMTSGLTWDETYDLGTQITEMLYLAEDMGAYAAQQPLEHDPGSYQEYSSGTTNILCDVLHERTGMGADMAHQLVFQPLGMSSAVLEPDADGDLVCSSYLWATARDWARFGLWFAQEGEWEGEQLLSPDWIDYSTTPVDVEGEEVGHAAHWWTNQLVDGGLVMPDVPADAYWASGHDGQRVVVIPSADVVVVRLGFSPGAEIGLPELLTGVVAAVGG